MKTSHIKIVNITFTLQSALELRPIGGFVHFYYKYVYFHISHLILFKFYVQFS